MPVLMDVEARADDRSFKQVIDRAKRDFGDAGRDAGRNFKNAISGSLDEAVRGITGQFGEVGRAASATFSGISTKAKVGALGVAGIGLAAVTVGKQFYDLGAQWDSIADGITLRTGKIGTELKRLTDVVGDVGRNTAASLGAIGDIVGQLEQSMPGLTENSAAIREMASNLAFLDANGQAVNIRELGKAFSAFGVGAHDQVRTLDSLAQVSRDTGIPLNQLVNTVQQGAPQFKQFGLNMSEATGLLAVFEDAGLNATSASTGLRRALANIGGDDPQQALADMITQIKALHDAGQQAAARDLAADLFGTRNFAPFLDAITSGRLGVEGLNKALDETGLTLQQMQQETDDGAQEFQKLANTLKTELGPVANTVFGAINDFIQYAGRNLHPVTEEARELAAIKPDADSIWNFFGNLAPKPGELPFFGSPSAGGVGAGARDRPTTPLAPQRDWWSGAIRPWDPKTGYGPPTGGSSGGPTMPVLPRTGDPMSLLQGFQPTSALYGAAESVLSARHDRAQAEAELNALEADNEATAEERQAARNKLLEADGNIYQAELRLAEAKQSAMDKYANTLKEGTSQLSEIGAQLDQDFGISQGLAGIAENLTKFLANLAAAPLLGRLDAIRQIDEAQTGITGGYGLLGMMGARNLAAGASPLGLSAGPGTFTGASQMGPAALQPGGGGGIPYGLPKGTDIRQGAAGFPPWVYQVGEAFGLKASTYAGHQEGKGVNQGIDWWGSPDNMQRFAEYLAGTGVMEQVIFQNPETGQKTGVANGQRVGPGTNQPGYYAGDFGGHTGHVHTRQSTSIPLPGGAGMPGGTGMPQWSADWNAIAQGESGGNWQIDTGNGYQGGLQFLPSSWAAAGGTQYAPSANLATPYQQAMTAEQLLAMQGPGAWPNTFVPGSSGPLPPGGGGNMFPQRSPFTMPPLTPGQDLDRPGIEIEAVPIQSGWWDPTYREQMRAGPPVPPAGGPTGVGGVGGAPWMPSQSPGVGGAAPAQGPTQIGGLAAPSGTGAGGIGITPGGSLDTAMGLAASAVPGLGQAAQTGMKLASRAIQYGGQVAGIGMQGLMETFLPTGGSQLAQNNWITRIVGGLAGAAPALPNMAGQSAAALSQPGVASGQGTGPPPGPPPINVTYNNNQATEDRAGADLTNHLATMYQGARR